MSLARLFDNYTESSGPGSTLEYTAPYREFLVKYILEMGVRTILDLGCGDLVVMNAVLEQAPVRRYVGIDCLSRRVAKNLELYPDLLCVHDDIRDAKPGHFAPDLVLCKDVLQHWDTASIIGWLHHMRHSFPFRRMLVTNCARGDEINWNIAMGEWRPVDLVRHPFSTGKVVFSWDTKDVVAILPL